MTLEERVQRLEDIQEITYLLGKYFNNLDIHNWEAVAETFDIDVHTEYCDGFMVYEGREDAVGFLESCMLPEQISTHLGHCFQIDIIDATHAKAKVYLEDHLINFFGHTNQHGTALYDDEFIKRDGKWYISKIGYERIYEEQYARNEYNSGHIGNVQYLKKAGYDVDEMQKR